MRYNICRAFEKTLDDKRSDYRRAFYLFEVCCAIYLSNRSDVAPTDKETNAIIYNIKPKMLRSARVAAASALMRAIETDMIEKEPGVLPRQRMLMRNPDYRWLHESIFQKNDGWKRVFELGDFLTALQEARWEGQNIGRLIEFSVRFEKNSICGNMKGGITSALTLAPEISNFNLSHSTTVLREFWTRRGHAAIWFYLNTIQKIRMRPPLPTAPSFRTILFQRLEDGTAQLALSHYNCVQNRLSSRDYNFPMLICNANIPESSISFEPIPDRWLQEVQPKTAI
ncbi:hypothetical protein [Falsiroseomonas sp. E2-1-a20]|uniref:hypothetical protein n=1 Tax=Falsiroseomonas sp. E2-1-a20 TaxID=3239300 RepID=UPI003F2F08E5